jgi:hypothetical protein
VEKVKGSFKHQRLISTLLFGICQKLVEAGLHPAAAGLTSSIGANPEEPGVKPPDPTRCFLINRAYNLLENQLKKQNHLNFYQAGLSLKKIVVLTETGKPVIDQTGRVCIGRFGFIMNRNLKIRFHDRQKRFGCNHHWRKLRRPVRSNGIGPCIKKCANYRQRVTL